ncbi:MAG: MFS transporter, partial [Burkholderiaceae bacterium]|nr:MFS transporter [Burkholderiaceae bacterium]
MPSLTNKPLLSFWQLWNMSFGFFGIQFGFALQNANTSRIFSTLGASPDDLPLFWLAAPVTGLLVQPVIGYLSDHTWHPTWGRRRPFFFIGAILASLALFLMPNSSALWMAVLVLWLMDAAINVSMEPFRAFVGDKLNSEQQTAGFAMQTFFIGCGAVIASLLPTLFSDVFGFSNESLNGTIPETVRYSFYAGGAIYFLAVMWTVFF